MTNPKGEEFRKYREIAPEGIDDTVILNLIKKSDGNHSAISAAIENMWHDLPDQKAVGMRDEWNTTSKSKSKKDSGVFQQAGRGGRGPQTGGRGPGGRGDRVGGRGPGGATSGRGTSVARPTVSTSHQPTARSGDSAIVDHPVSQPAVVSGWGSPTATVTATASAPTISASASSTAASTSSSGWGSGGTTLAEKLKLAEIQKLLPPPVLVVVVAAVEEMEESTAASHTAATAATESTGEKVPRRSRGRNSAPSAKVEVEPVVPLEVGELVCLQVAAEEKIEALIEDVIEISIVGSVIEVTEEAVVEVVVVVPAPAPVVEVVVPVQEVVEVVVPKAFLKMGKWEAPESSAFQFGSFGNYVTEDTMSTPAPWGGVAAENEQQIQSDSPAGVWGANGSNNGEVSSSSSGPSPMSSLFPVPKGLTSASSEGSPSGVISSSHIQNGRYDQQKPSAPPGLEISKPVARQDSRSAAPGQTQSRGKSEVSQQQLQQQQQQQLQQQQQQQLQQQQQQYQQPQYQQQAPAATPGSARGQAPAPGSSMLYGYAPGFDSQYQQSSYGPPTSIAPPPVTGSPVATAGATATQSQGVAPGAPQALQYGPPPGMAGHYVNPYYSSPYYGSQYFYGPSVLPNPYYNQGRGDYQSNRYPNDPYAAAGQYPNLYHQGGGFPDQGMAMQQHPSMGQQNQVQGQSGSASATGAPSASGQGKQQKGASAAVVAPQQQDPNQGYGYNPYNPRDSQWQYGWNAPIMGFPGGSPTGAGGPQGFSQPLQQQQSGQGQRPSSSGYGGPAGQGQQSQGQGQQSFSRGPGVPNATGPPSGGGTGQHW